MKTNGLESRPGLRVEPLFLENRGGLNPSEDLLLYLQKRNSGSIEILPESSSLSETEKENKVSCFDAMCYLVGGVLFL